MLLSDLMDVHLLAKMLDEGYVNRQYHPRLPLAILNYSHQTQFAQEWNEVTTQTRGLIYNLNSEVVVARPFKKFFNASELGPSKLGQALGTVQVTDKLDGSLGILYLDTTTACGYSIATRGSFTSDQALKACAILEDAYLSKSDWLPSPLHTYLFEIIYPENRIVLNYGDRQELVFLGTVNNVTGKILGPEWGYGMEGCWPGPRAEVFEATSYKEVKALPIRDNAEGFVLRNIKSDFMCKMKYDEYVRIHRIVFGMNEKRVYEHLRAGRGAGELYEGVPEEFWQWITICVAHFQHEFDAIKERAENDLADIDLEMMDSKTFGRKAFAELAKDRKYPGLLFLMLDGRPIDDAIWKLIRYDGTNKMAAEQSEDVA
jgi:RNA ligase